MKTEFFDNKKVPFPETSFMSAETLVDITLAALDQQEWICYPNLEDYGLWEQFDAARGNLAKVVSVSGQSVTCYQSK
ncbi:hypothetical protein [Caviibacterium pharyngocola]|uniref:Uncharacterized protein n=1 Tax=Caviibacterium pharyngocola TaxID=28159 RepID=A0A2M8RTP6_9PAST|nr:hypothetical protein [Caviibacterium pharyngocola]PJG82271.1 hypothetical protein CVP04_09915 [Caviibacterium pharyngocola]